MVAMNKKELLRRFSGVDKANSILQEVNGLESLFSAYSMYVKPPHPKADLISVTEAVNSVLKIFEFELVQKRITVDLSLDGTKIHFDTAHLRQILLQLLSNSLKYTPGGGTIHIASGVHSHQWFLTVQDTGCGVQPGDVPRIFEPFFSTHDNHTGLGLAICQKLATVNNAEIKLDTNSPRGCGFSLRKNIEL